MGRLRSFALVVLVVAVSSSASAQSCNTIYSDNGTPLLFGGVAERCISPLCKPRDDYWGKTCSFNYGQTWGVCSEEQRRNNLELARTINNGQAMKLTPCQFIKYIRGRTLWLIGDSHSKSFYRALQCFLIDFWDHQECEASPDGAAVSQLYNLPVSTGESKCFHLLSHIGGRVCIVHAVLGTSLVDNRQIASGGVLPLLRERFANRKDIFLINFGVWHKKNPQYAATFRPALNALAEYYKATRSQWPHMLFRETPAEHPKEDNGQSCGAMRGFIYQPDTGRLEVDSASRLKIQGWISGQALNQVSRAVLSRAKMPIVPAFNISVPLHDNHIGRHMNTELDCLHYCSPGVPEMWIWYLFKAMRDGKAGIQPITNTRTTGQMEAATRMPRYVCVPSTTMF